MPVETPSVKDFKKLEKELAELKEVNESLSKEVEKIRPAIRRLVNTVMINAQSISRLSQVIIKETEEKDVEIREGITKPNDSKKNL